jgi:DNA-directed RNA polymerase subunit M/transcription elongation factor TFIIS
MARIHTVQKAQARYERVPKLDAHGNPVVTPVLRKDGTQKTTKTGKPVVVNVTVDDKTKPKPNRTCGKCGKEIEPGMPYRWVQPKSGPYGGTKRYRCMECPTWRESELTTSKMAGVYAAQEQVDDELYTCEEMGDLESLRDDVADQVEAVADEYEESAQNIVDGFGHETSMSEELADKASMLRDWAEDIRNVAFDDFDEPDEMPDDDEDDREATVEEAKEDWINEQRERLSDEMGNCPV